jgi:hypothetical protein
MPLSDRVCKLKDWWNAIVQHNNNNNGQEDHNCVYKILDVRPLQSTIDSTKTSCSRNGTQNYRRLSFEATCCPSTTTTTIKVDVVQIPVNELNDRSFELPARHVTFSLLVRGEDLETVSNFLLYGNCNTRQTRNDTDDEQDGQQQKKKKQKSRRRQGRTLNPWKVTHVMIDDDELWDEASRLGLVVETKNDCAAKNMTTSAKATMGVDVVYGRRDTLRRPLPRLWQPDSMVENVLLPLLKQSIQSDRLGGQQSSQMMEVWDLASGSGRDVAFLAEELQYFCHQRLTGDRNSRKDGECREDKCMVVGCDHRYNARETAVVSSFWIRRRVDGCTRPLKVDLSQWSTLHQQIYMPTMLAMYCVRFWKPELVTAIASCDSIPTGVLFAISHFCKVAPGVQWDFDHPSQKTVLERNQLSGLFSSHGWTILHDEIATDSDHGRTMIQFVARR